MRAMTKNTAIADRNPGRTWLVFALVAAIGLTAVSAWRQGWFTPTAHVYVVLPAANGIQTGMPVKVKGFVIGEVDDVRLQDNLDVLVRMRLTSAKMALLGADARVRFGRDGPIGAKYIDIAPGARQGPRLPAEKVLPLEAGTEIEDVMATVKTGVEKLTRTLEKLDPILDDTRKLTSEATAMREDVRKSLTSTLAEIQGMSGELRQTSVRARGLVGNIDSDRAKVVDDVRRLLGQVQDTTADVRGMVLTVQGELAPSLKLARELLGDARVAGADVRRMVGETRDDVPALVRSGRSAAQDAADITQGLKQTWPISSLAKPADAGALPLSGYEGAAP
jgi:phospholipid/cholesterol/gamma-HCH transport system substrate-binding protein